MVDLGMLQGHQLLKGKSLSLWPKTQLGTTTNSMPQHIVASLATQVLDNDKLG